MRESILENVKIASPCTVSWESMRGDDRTRFCGQCQLNVFNLSGMSKAEAESLVSSRQGRLCVRFYRRQDGTILTQDCPVGLRAARLRMAKLVGAVAGFLGLTFYGILKFWVRDYWIRNPPLMGVISVSHAPSPALMGEVAPQELLGKIKVP